MYLNFGHNKFENMILRWDFESCVHVKIPKENRKKDCTHFCLHIFAIDILVKWATEWDGDFLGTVNSRGHFFSKWANSSGYFLRVNSRGHCLSTRIPLLWWIFVDIFWVNFSGHFLMVITNGANTVGQPQLGVRAESPARLSEHCSVHVRLG